VAFTLSEEKLWGTEALTPDALAIGVFESVDVIDERTVRVTTAFPDPALISRLQSHIGRVIPRDYFLEVGVDAFRQAPIGTGPYSIESFEARDEVRLVAFDDYWGGTPPVASITYRDIPEQSTRVAGLLSGELDLIVGVIPQQLDLLEREGFRVEVMPQENIQMFSFMSGPDELPIHDARIRRALVLAADLDTIAEELFGGTVTPLVNVQSSAYGDYFEMAPSLYDPEEARRLVEEAGYEGEGIKLQFIANNFVLVNETALLLQEMWADVGLKVQLDIIPDFTLHTLNPPTDVSMWSTSNNISMPDPFNPVCTTFTGDSFYAARERITISEDLDSLCTQLEQTTDFDERLAIWQAIQEAWAADPQALFLWQRPEIYALRPDLDWQAFSDFSIAFGPSVFPAMAQ
jgi:peptide/nickel transport system substrate-binding protein